jgi:hypothetical protein
VKYDIQVLAERIEFCWIHLRGVGTLENSLWAYDAQGIRVWLNALSLESHEARHKSAEDVKENVRIPLDFYPLCKESSPCCRVPLMYDLTAVLMDKGIIIGVEHELAIRSNLPFVLFRHSTSVSCLLQRILCRSSNDYTQSHLFLQHILLYHLENRQVNEAVAFASHYKNLVFFPMP